MQDLGYLWSGWVIVAVKYVCASGLLLAIVCSAAGLCGEDGKRREAADQRTVPQKPPAGLQRAA